MKTITISQKNIIICVSGKLGNGKDSVADLIRKNSNLEFKQTAFAKKLKQIVSILCEQDYEMTLSQEGKNLYIEEYDRTIGQLLQEIGTDVMRDNFDKQVWIKSLQLELKNKPGNYIITDLRFKNEAKALKDSGAILIRVNRPNNPVALNSNRDLNHPSEIDLDDYNEFDYVINNDGTLEDLESKVKLLINKLELDRVLI